MGEHCDIYEHNQSNLWVHKNGSNVYISQERYDNEVLVTLTEEVAKEMAEWILKKERDNG